MAEDASPADRVDQVGDLQGQAELFPAKLSARANRKALRADSPVVDADEAGIERRFGGRRPGATNIATKQRLELFARISGDPLLASARVLAMPLDQLAAMLGCSPKDAAEFQQRERYLAMPYVLSKRPLDVNLNDKTPPALHLHFPLPGAGAPALALGGGAVGLLAAHAAGLARGTVTIMSPEESAEETDG